MGRLCHQKGFCATQRWGDAIEDEIMSIEMDVLSSSWNVVFEWGCDVIQGDVMSSKGM